MVVVQTSDISGLVSRLYGLSSCGSELLHVRVEQDVEGFAGSTVDVVVEHHVELVEERLVGDPSQVVVDSHVELMAVACELQAVVDVGVGMVVFDVADVDLGFEDDHATGDLVLLLLHQIERHGAIEVDVQELGSPVVELLAFDLVGAAFTP